MILDNELELLNKKEVTSAAVTGSVVKLGKTVSAAPCVIVVSADGLEAASGEGVTGGSALTVEIQTSDNANMADAETIATFTRAAGEGILLQTGIPFDVKEYVRLKVTPTGTFAAGTVSANVAYGPELAAK